MVFISNILLPNRHLLIEYIDFILYSFPIKGCNAPLLCLNELPIICAIYNYASNIYYSHVHCCLKHRGSYKKHSVEMNSFRNNNP